MDKAKAAHFVGIAWGVTKSNYSQFNKECGKKSFVCLYLVLVSFCFFWAGHETIRIMLRWFVVNKL